MIKKTLQRIEERDFFLIAGPCVIESEALCMKTAEAVVALAQKWDLPYVFKSSFTKANRLSKGSYTGPGMDEGLAVLAKVRSEFEIPVLTDIHETIDISAVAGLRRFPRTAASLPSIYR